MLRSLLGAALLACFAAQFAVALPTISVKGDKFFAGGQQFFLKGVAYQGTPADPLVDTNQCQLDATSMKAIGTNSIRVYHVDPYSNHDGCMAAFSDAGIYAWLDLDTFNTTVVQIDPIWTQEQFFAFALVMDVFQGYDNLGGFWIGNEVINTASGSPSAPYIKAATADMKSYMAAKKYRTIPIGYSAADIAELRPMLQNYLACGDNYAQSIDFFGLNSYEWCGAATYETSGYSNLQAMAQGYNIPIFFSETGCNVGGDRTFQDQTAIFSPNMVGTWSGSIIYEWVEETNHYGLVNYPNGQIYSGAPTPIQPDYDNLMNVWKTISPSGIAEAGYTATFSPPACPMASAGWGVDGDVPLPTLGSSVVAAAAANQKHTPVPTTSSAKPSTSASSTSTGTISASSTASIASSSEFVLSSASSFDSSSATSSSSIVPRLSSRVPSTSSSVLPGVTADALADVLLKSFATAAISSSSTVPSTSSTAQSISISALSEASAHALDVLLKPSATPLHPELVRRYFPNPVDINYNERKKSKEASARSSSSAAAAAATNANSTASPTSNNDNAVSTTAPAPSASTSHSGAKSLRTRVWPTVPVGKLLSGRETAINKIRRGPNDGFFEQLFKPTKVLFNGTHRVINKINTAPDEMVGQMLNGTNAIIREINGSKGGPNGTDIVAKFLDGTRAAISEFGGPKGEIALILLVTILTIYFEHVAGYGFDFDLEQGQRESIGCDVVRGLSDVDIVFQRARERRERRERGLPPGTLTGNAIVLKSLRKVETNEKGKERLIIRGVRVVSDREERNMLRLD
ncbi:uncharacterized protein PAC_02760 [Phialocephala subalpina]|uniref:1,3-beta-glucanosyltransferase n=1 Tax=Phialocephala subalpina TaxID=576137 RepID=A0A1L7WJD7_9HELO|nr:uncharacterized protein PAC_02760 [Phialocephala subalpina]